MNRAQKGIFVKTGTTKLVITYQPVAKLKSNPRNSRIHSKHQVRQIADSIKEFGFVNSLLLDKDGMVVAGHGRLEAAKLLGIVQVPTILLDDLSPDQLRAFAIADNRLAERAGWDTSILAVELQHLLSIDTKFDVTITGFEMPEIDLLLSAPTDKSDPDDSFEKSDAPNATSQPGSIWQLGRHRILCANAIEQDSYSILLGKKRADVVFVDPPYNLAIAGHVSGNGSVHHREFPMASGEMSEFEFTSFLTSSLRLLARYSANNSIHFICMDWRHVGELIAAGRQVYESLINLCVWIKNNGGMGSFYRSRHELIFVFRNGKGKHKNNVQLGLFGRNRTNVWEYPTINTLSKTGDEGNLLALHPTVKPVSLVADALLDCSSRGDLVLDAFLGSGSTLVAAERTGRCCFGIELDPIYVDTAVKRWQRYTGDHAIDTVSGKRFNDISRGNLEAHHG